MCKFRGQVRGAGLPCAVLSRCGQEASRGPGELHYHRKRTWARDTWHLTSRALRKTLSPTVAVFFCQLHGLSPLAFDQLVD